MNDAPLDTTYKSPSALQSCLAPYRLHLMNEPTIYAHIDPMSFRAILNADDYRGCGKLIRLAEDEDANELRKAIYDFVQQHTDLHRCLRGQGSDDEIPPPVVPRSALGEADDPRINDTYTDVAELVDGLTPSYQTILGSRAFTSLLGVEVSRQMSHMDEFEAMQVLVAFATRPDRWRLRVELLRFVRSKGNLHHLLQDPNRLAPSQAVLMQADQVDAARTAATPSPTAAGGQLIRSTASQPIISPASTPTTGHSTSTATSTSLAPSPSPAPSSQDFSQPLPVVVHDGSDLAVLRAQATNEGVALINKDLGGSRIVVHETHVLFPDPEHVVVRYFVEIQRDSGRIKSARISLALDCDPLALPEARPLILNVFPQAGQLWQTGPEATVTASDQKTFSVNVSAATYGGVTGGYQVGKSVESKATSSLTVSGPGTTEMIIILKEGAGEAGIVPSFAFGMYARLPQPTRITPFPNGPNTTLTTLTSRTSLGADQSQTPGTVTVGIGNGSTGASLLTGMLKIHVDPSHRLIMSRNCEQRVVFDSTQQKGLV